MTNETNENVTKEELDVIVKIIERADNMGLLQVDRLTLLIDLKHTHLATPLKLEELLASDEANFTHDITGIQHYMNRETHKIEEHFTPRYTR